MIGKLDTTRKSFQHLLYKWSAYDEWFYETFFVTLFKFIKQIQIALIMYLNVFIYKKCSEIEI